MTDQALKITYKGDPLDTSARAYGELRRSDDAAGDVEELRHRMEEDGYLFLPGLLDRDQVLAARHTVAERFAAEGMLAEGHPIDDCIAGPGVHVGFRADVAADNAALDRVLYDGPMIAFYEAFLGGPVRHYDYTWFRAKSPGIDNATQPHYDVVYMGRGTRRLFTSWTPLSDIDYEMGGLMVLENSHRQEELIATYGQQDVDKYCDNDETSHALVESARATGRDLSGAERGQVRWESPTFGSYSNDAIATRQELGGRWLTAEYCMGDLLVFSMYTLHSSTDNYSGQVRLSADSRYQLASEPVDDRWVGEEPPLHGIRAHKGMIC